MKTSVISAFLVVSAGLTHAENWPSWRGNIQGSGQSAESSLPTSWTPEQNVLWRVELPDRGNSTPVVWENQVFVTQAIDAENWRGLLCFNRSDGALLWKKGLTYDKEERSHKDNPYASASASTDGEIVVAAFGSAGVVAWDLEGNEVWKRLDFGAIDHTWGSSTSPVIHGDLVYHYHGPSDDESTLYALNRATGETVWQWQEPDWDPGERTDGFQGRDNEGVIGSWSTPIIVDNQLIMSFPMQMMAFDLQNGDVLWTCEGLNALVYTSPIAEDGVIVAQGGYKGNSIAVKTNGERIWQEIRHFGGIGTGVLHEGHLYAQDAGGIVHCVDVSNGETLWKDRLPGAGKSWGSWIKSGGNIYTLSQAGDTVIFEPSTEGLKVVSEGNVGEHTNSSIAASEGQLFIRTWEALWCIGQED